MKKFKIDLKEQICRALRGNIEKCDRCGFIGKIRRDLFKHYSYQDNKLINVCYYCHREEHRKEKDKIKRILANRL